MRAFLTELKRRRVYRVGVVYGAIAFVIWQAAEISFPALGFPPWSLAFIIVLTFLGLPIALVLAWAFEITPEGVRRTEPPVETATRIEASNRAIAAAAGVAVLALAIVAAWLAIRDGGPTASSDRKSIAVLPFDNLSSDPEVDQHFAEGIHDEIITYLSKIGDLKVTSRTSVMVYKDTDTSLRDIAAALDVATVLEGTVRRAADRVRITAQLIDAQTDEHLWTDVYERDYADIFAIQVEVAEHVATALRATLTPELEQRIRKRPTESLVAYDLYLRGRYFWNRRSRDDFYRAIEHFEQAIEEDPVYAQAYAGIADTYNLLAVYWMLPPSEAVPLAKAAAERALELDLNVAEAHNCLAHIHTWYDWNWPEAEARFAQALSLKRAGLSSWTRTRSFYAITWRDFSSSRVATTRPSLLCVPRPRWIQTSETHTAGFFGSIPCWDGTLRRLKRSKPLTS
jgi:TolB-like protein